MNEVIIPITPIMKLKAFNQATFMKNRSGNKIQQYGEDFTNSSEEQSFNNSIVGELGELAFREYLKDNNLYYTDDERELINKGHDYNSATKKTDMGDFFCSKTQESIDLKINDANIKVSNLILEAKSESEKIINDGMQKAQKQSELLLQQANILVEKKYKDFELEQKKIIIENAVELARKILKRELKDKDNKKLISELMEN